MDPIYLRMTNGEEAQQLNDKPAKAGGMDRQAGSIAYLASGFGPQICFSAPDSLAGGGDPAPSPTPTDPAPKADPAPKDPANPDPKGGKDPADPAPKKVERPDWLPETLWDAEKGFKKEDFDSLVATKAERDAAKAQVPEKPDGYAAKLPATFKLPEGFELPEGETIEVDEADPRIVALRDVAHAKGWSQSDFEDVIAFGIQQDLAEKATMKELVGKEREKLGGRAKERISAVTTWLDAKLGPVRGAALHSMMFTATQMEAFEALQRLARGDVPGTPGAGREAAPVEMPDEEYNKMTPTQKINYARGLKG